MATRESWKPRSGNHYIMKGTWVRNPHLRHKTLGVISDITQHDDDSFRDGSINILWYSGTSSHLSAKSLRRKLRTGELVIDYSQHPYDKTDWANQATDIHISCERSEQS